MESVSNELKAASSIPSNLSGTVWGFRWNHKLSYHRAGAAELKSVENGGHRQKVCIFKIQDRLAPQSYVGNSVDTVSFLVMPIEKSV